MVIDASRSPWLETRSCQLEGIRVSETVVAAGAALNDHSHPTGQICFLLEGEMRERLTGRVDCLRPGAVRSHAPGFRHRVKVSSEEDVLALLLFVDAERWIATTPTRAGSAGGPLRYYAAQIRRELGKLDEAGRAALEGWTMLAIAAAARGRDVPRTAPPPWLDDAVSMIERRAAENISLSTLASSLGVHRATLAAAFRRYRQISVGEAIREVRVRNVMRALTEKRVSLCEVATQNGFHDQAHMGRVFRQTVGLSPGAFRQLRR